MTKLDEFRGDTANLIRSIEALLKLDADGALYPHGIGGLARTLLSASAVRLAATASAEAVAWQWRFKLTDGPWSDWNDGQAREWVKAGPERREYEERPLYLAPRSPEAASPAVTDAVKPLLAVVKALDGQYGFDDDKAVDCRHFGPPNNDFPPLTYGDLRRLAAALALPAAPVSTVTAYVVMGNDYPAAVYLSEAEAKARCYDEDAKNEQRKKDGYGHIYWRVYDFDLTAAAPVVEGQKL